MAAPITGESNLSEHPSDHHNHNNGDLHIMKAEFKSPTSVGNDSTISQPSKSKTTTPPAHPPPAPLAPFTPSPPPPPSSQAKRRKVKPVRYGFPQTNAKKQHSPSELKTVPRVPLSTSSSFKKGKAAFKDVHTPVESLPSMIRAREIQSSLGTDKPSFIKLMVRSHVDSCFWMGLPVPFCKLFLPNDTTVVIEDENGEKYVVKYIAYRSGFSGGWRNFAIEHNLVEGDALVFHLVDSCKFKVYIVRAKNSKGVDGALSLLNLEAPKEKATTEDNATVVLSPKPKRRGRPRSLLLNAGQKKQKMSKPSSRSIPSRLSSHPVEHVGNDVQEVDAPAEKAMPVPKDNTTIILSPKPKRKGRPRSLPLKVDQKKQKKSTPSSRVITPPQPSNDVQEVGSEIVEGPRFSTLQLSFGEVKSYEDFHIVVNGVCIDSELQEDVRINYYNLCLGKNKFLHDVLPQRLHYKLVAGMIAETVSISNEIRNCKLTTTKEEFETWTNSLKSFELLGMKVGFLRDRIRVLASFASESEGALDITGYRDAKKQKNQTEDEMKKLETKYVELKETCKKLAAILDSLKQKAERYELKFQELVNAPW